MLKYLIPIYIILLVVSFDPKLHTGGDNVTYLCLSKSIATGQGYTDIDKPDNPSHQTFPIVPSAVKSSSSGL